MYGLIGALLYVGAVVLILRGEISIRRIDRKYAHEFPAKVDAARTELKVRRQTAALQSHLTVEDLEFLQDDLPQARDQLRKKRLAAAQAAQQEIPVSGEIIQTTARLYSRSQVDAYYMKNGRYPWEYGTSRKPRK